MPFPTASGNTKAVSDWCAAFAKARGLECRQDALNNLIIIKEATPGYEGAEPVILQGHLDMVCEKGPGCQKDLEREGLDLEVDGDFVRARETTLGGDDGIAVAMALALLDARDLPHPRLEVVLTVDEEVGMLGAAALDVSPLRGRTLINLDSEEEGVFTVSCAGGNRTKCVLPIKREPFPGTALTVWVGGLTGGHSGTEIHRGRANANQLLGRCLRAVSARTPLRLSWAEGGSKDNAIPTHSRAQIVVSDGAAARAALEKLEADLLREYRSTDPGLTIQAEEGGDAPAPPGQREHPAGGVHAHLPAQRGAGHERGHPRAGADLPEPGHSHHGRGGDERLLLGAQLPGLPEGGPEGPAGLFDGGAGGQGGVLRGLSGLGVPGGLPPAGADGPGVPGSSTAGSTYIY